MTGPSGRAPESTGFEHLTDADVAGYLDRDLTPEERRRIETHIDRCAACREELIALSRITQPRASAEPPRVRRRRWWIPAAAAAAVAALIVPNLTINSPEPGALPPTRRLSDGDGRARLTITSPSDGIVPSGRLVFAWRSGKADVYRIFLLAESGDPVWITDTGDTTIALPDSVALQPGRAYFWRVEGIGTGIAATTGVHRIQIPRP